MRTCSFTTTFSAIDRCSRFRHGSVLVNPGRPLDRTHVTDGHRRKRQLGTVLHFDVDVDREAEVIGRDGVHVEDEATDRR